MQPRELQSRREASPAVNTSAKGTYDTPRRVSLWLRCTLVLVLIVAAIVFAANMVNYHQYRKAEAASRAESEQYQLIIDRSERYLNGNIDYDEIVRIAREKFNLAFPDETVYYFGQGAKP